MRLATIRLKTRDQLDDSHVVYLETDEGIARVVAPIEAWHRAEVGVSLEVPDGDLEHPQVQAGISWKW